MLKIIRADQALTIPPLTLAIYGEPGSWKTSLASTAEDPLLLDFDRGSHRSAFRKEVVQITDWTEISEITPADLAGFKTLIVDTAGRALDVLTAHIARTEPKLIRSSGDLSLQGYGALKSYFLAWMKRVREAGLDIVMLAHAREDKNRDDVIDRPDLQGGSRDELFKMSDAMAFLHLVGKRRYLEFAPSDAWQAKDPAGLDQVEVPSLETNPHLLASIVRQIKGAISQNAESSRRIVGLIQEFREEVNALEDAEAANALAEHLKTQHLERAVSVPVFHLIMERGKAVGFFFDRTTKAFAPKTEKAEPDTADKPNGQQEPDAEDKPAEQEKPTRRARGSKGSEKPDASAKEQKSEKPARRERSDKGTKMGVDPDAPEKPTRRNKETSE